jgi:hypothetical protein
MEKVKIMDNYTFKVVLVDSGLPYSTKEDAEHDAREWADGIADSENCMVAEVTVEKES